MTLLDAVGDVYRCGAIELATQLTNRCILNLIDVVGLYITFCNALSGHITRMHDSCKLPRRVMNKLQFLPLYEHYESSQRSCGKLNTSQRSRVGVGMNGYARV